MFSVRCLIALLLLALGAAAGRAGLRQSIITEIEKGVTEEQAKEAEDSKAAQDAEKNVEDDAEGVEMVGKDGVPDDSKKANVVAHEPSASKTLPVTRQSWTDYAKGLAWRAKDMDSPIVHWDAPTGRPFYENEETQLSYWQHPTKEANPVKAYSAEARQAKDNAMQEHISGWTVHWDATTGRPFYENKETQVSYWHHPTKEANPVKASSAESRLPEATAAANTTNEVYWRNKIEKSEKETRRYLDRIAELEAESFRLRLNEYLNLMNNFVSAEKANEKKIEQIDEVREMFKDEVRETIKVARFLMQETRRKGVISEDMQKWFNSLKQVLERVVKMESFQRRLGQYLDLLNFFVSEYPDLMNEFVSDAEGNEKWPEQKQKVKMALAVTRIRTGKMIEEASTLMEDATKNGVISWAMQRRFDRLGQQLEAIMKIVYSEVHSAGL